jgi:DNA transformation protein and related proteins
MVKNSPLLEYLLDQLEPLGGISSRVMFGGHALMRQGLMVGFVDNETLYLKADDTNRPAFEKEGMRPFTYATKRGKRIALGYWEAPPAVIEEPEELQRWVLDAASAAKRRHAAKTPRKSTRKSESKPRNKAARAGK